MRRFSWSVWSAVAFWIIVASWILPGTGQAQTAGRRAATLASLSGSPIFFHGQQVVVQADAVRAGVLTYLVDGETAWWPSTCRRRPPVRPSVSRCRDDSTTWAGSSPTTRA